MLLIKNAIILDTSSPFHRQKLDIFIKNGKIQQIAKALEVEGVELLDAEGGFVSIGWMDWGVHACEPGFEHKEDLKTAAAAAAAGGFTAISVLPNTFPTIQSKTEVEFIKNSTRSNIVDIYPIGSISKECKGSEISEMYDMYQSGAVAFSDGNNAMQDSGLMLRALQYVKPFDGLVMNHPHDKNLSGGGQVHESVTSTSLGLKGIPDLAEEMMLLRDLYLLEYAQSRLHISNISTARSVDLIKQAKEKGYQVTTSVAVLNIALDDTSLLEFDTNLKVLPPLRENEDIAALKEGLKNGVIDVICSNHIPQDEELKNLEFPYAAFGAIGLQTAFSVMNEYLSDTLSWEQILEKIAINPRKLLKLPIPTIQEGKEANLTIFDTNKTWTLEEKNILSRSKNSPFIGKELKGKVLGVVNNKKWNVYK